MGFSLVNMLRLCELYIAHIQHVIENSSFCTTYKSYLSTGFAMKIMPILRILSYNGSLITWTVISLTADKFKPLIFRLSRNGSWPSLYSLGADRTVNTVPLLHAQSLFTVP
jgi:hypothetical protein